MKMINLVYDGRLPENYNDIILHGSHKCRNGLCCNPSHEIIELAKSNELRKMCHTLGFCVCGEQGDEMCIFEKTCTHVSLEQAFSYLKAVDAFDDSGGIF